MHGHCLCGGDPKHVKSEPITINPIRAEYLARTHPHPLHTHNIPAHLMRICEVTLYIYGTHIHLYGQTVHIKLIPGSLSSIVMTVLLRVPISTALGWSVELIATLKYSDSSVVLSSMVDTIKVADVSPAVNLTVYAPAS